MRLTTFLSDIGPRLGIIADGELLDVGSIDRRWPVSMNELIERADALLPELAEWLGGRPRAGRPLDPAILLAPLAHPGKIVAIGLNYADHAAEGGAQVPSEPLVFAKFASSLVGPGMPITWDCRLTDAVDYEAELAVIIGRTARHVSQENALEHVFGYTCLNDVSARDLQFADGQWVRGKSLDSFCPLGPWIVTADEIPDPQQLEISCVVSGELLQRANTADMFFPVAELIARLSRAFTLQPGDIIATGTPPGVGFFRQPKRLLRHGDEVVVAIQGIGELRNPVVVSGSA